MATLSPTDVPTRDLAKLKSVTSSFPDGPLKSALDDIYCDLRRGETLVVVAENRTVTPSVAARILGLSRTHLYKILDSGALPFHVVGERDRRIVARDLDAYRTLLVETQRRTALMFASGTAVDDAALDEMS